METSTELYAKYAQSRDKKSRDALILSLKTTIKSVLSKYGSSRASIRHEQEQEAYIAVMENIDKYDSSLGVQINSWLYWHIRNAVTAHAYNAAYPVVLSTHAGYGAVYKAIRNGEHVNTIVEKTGVSKDVADSMVYWLRSKRDEDTELSTSYNPDTLMGLEESLAQMSELELRAILTLHVDKDVGEGNYTPTESRDRKAAFYHMTKVKQILERVLEC